MPYEYKGNIKPPTDKWERIHFDLRKKMVSVQQYVKYGDFQSTLFEEEISKYVKQLKCHLLPSDPFLLLKNEYWLHSQEWVKEKMEECLERLENRNYEIEVFGEMIVIFCTLKEIGFAGDYVTRLREGITASIPKLQGQFRIDTELHFVEEPQIREQVVQLVSEINEEIHTHVALQRRKTITEILNEQNWVELLQEYTESSYYTSSLDRTIFCKADAMDWVNAIMKSDPMRLFKFRQLLGAIYPRNVIHETAKKDMPVMKEIWEAMDPESADDLIKKFDLGLVKQEFEEILLSYDEFDAQA